MQATDNAIDDGPTQTRSTGCMWARGLGIIVLILIATVTVVIGRAVYREMQPAPEFEIAGDANESERLEQLDQWILELHQAGKFNGGVLVARGGEPLLMKTYGYADANEAKPLTDQTAFRLASVSKQFTAAGILRLAETKQVQLDQPVSRYLQGFPFAGVTLRHLLNQTSGIPDVYMDLARQHRDELGEVLRIGDVAELIRRYPPDSLPPGNEHEYSNTNYVLLAAVIEAVSGQSYEVFMQEQLFKPLGMQDTRVFNRVSTDQDFPHRAEDLNYALGFRMSVPMTWIDGVAGDGAVFCSLRDFLVWDDFWHESSLVSDELLIQAILRAQLNDGISSYYGFGWVISSPPGRTWHNGAWLGARTYFARDSISRTCVVVLDNASGQLTETIAREIQSQVFPARKQYGYAPRLSPFTEVRFDDGQVIVTCDGTVYQWLELNDISVKQIVKTSKLHYGEDWQRRIACDTLDVLWRMNHKPSSVVKLRLRRLDDGQDVVINDAPMTTENRSAARWNWRQMDMEAAYEKEDGQLDHSNLRIDHELRARLVGRYQLSPTFIFDVQDRDGHLMVGITNQKTQEVFSDSPTRWSYRSVDATLEFKLKETGSAHRLVLHQNGKRKHAERIEE